MGDVEGENYDSLLRNLTNANTMLLNDASETLEFNSIDALDQVCLNAYNYFLQVKDIACAGSWNPVHDHQPACEGRRYWEDS